MLDFASSMRVVPALRAAVLAGLDPLVVVVDRDREGLLRGLLADDVALEELVDLPRLGEFLPPHLGGLGELLLDDLVAEIDALVADVHTGSCDELLHLLLALSAERALEQVAAITDACHEVLPLRLGAAWFSGLLVPAYPTVPCRAPRSGPPWTRFTLP